MRYMVVEPRAGAVLSVAEEKTEALSAARRLIQATEDLMPPKAEVAPHQITLWPEEALPRVSEPDPSPTSTSRRRRQIFERSDGKCHYCGTELQLGGKWHVEHQMPKALGGADDACNLVAACVPCNLSKRDRTAIEFVADQAST